MECGCVEDDSNIIRFAIEFDDTNYTKIAIVEKQCQFGAVFLFRDSHTRSN